ncbi:MAG: energy transducer TonB [Sphingobacteriaceae bacterium]|nr:energy transducer TonB [Sphingobacteriaceae bacterium]
MEINFGNYNEGTGNVEQNGIGEATSVITEQIPTPPTANSANDPTYTSETGEDVKVEDNKVKTNTNVTVIKPVVETPKPKTQAELIAEKFKQNQGKTGGGDGNSGHAGNDGSPDGNPNTNGTGGTGGGDGGGDGPGHGPGSGPGSGPGKKFGFDLKGRAIVNPPTLPKDTKEEGKVVVEITVDKEGNVISASPNGRGTTTSSAILKSKARMAALATKFNVSGAFEEQTGTITIEFKFN